MTNVEMPEQLINDLDIETAARVGWAWRDIRRGTTASDARDVIYGVGGSAIEPGQMDALDLLAKVDTCRMGDLADHLRIDPSTATRAVQRLIKDGLAERIAHEGDGRVVTIAATERGRRIYGEVAARRRALTLDILSGFTPDERHQLADFLERFNAGMDRAVKARKQRRR
jgi:DNA-binding MarR family transcriptional regulator